MGAITKQATADEVQASRITDTLRIEERVAELLIDDRQDRPVPTIRTQEINDHQRQFCASPRSKGRVARPGRHITEPPRGQGCGRLPHAESLVMCKPGGAEITDLHIKAGRS